MKTGRKDDYVVCPFCGECIPSTVKACPACGSDEKTGWSEDTYLDGVDLPVDDDYKDLVLKEFGGETVSHGSWQKRTWITVAAIGLLALAGLGMLLNLLR